MPASKVSITADPVQITGGQVGVLTRISGKVHIDAEVLSISPKKNGAGANVFGRHFIIDPDRYLIDRGMKSSYATDSAPYGQSALAEISWDYEFEFVFTPDKPGSYYVSMVGLSENTYLDWPVNKVFEYLDKYFYEEIVILPAEPGPEPAAAWLPSPGFQVAIGGLDNIKSYSFDGLTIAETVDRATAIGDKMITILIPAGTMVMGTSKLLVNYTDRVVVEVPEKAVFFNPVEIYVDGELAVEFTDLPLK